MRETDTETRASSRATETVELLLLAATGIAAIAAAGALL